MTTYQLFKLLGRGWSTVFVSFRTVHRRCTRRFDEVLVFLGGVHHCLGRDLPIGAFSEALFVLGEHCFWGVVLEKKLKKGKHLGTKNKWVGKIQPPFRTEINRTINKNARVYSHVLGNEYRFTYFTYLIGIGAVRTDLHFRHKTIVCQFGLENVPRDEVDSRRRPLEWFYRGKVLETGTARQFRCRLVFVGQR